MLARAVATESRSTFFAIGAGSLTSKFLGESEKLVRALFACARLAGPSIVFVDEIESLLGRRGEGAHDAVERVKTEFLVGWGELQAAVAASERGDGGGKEGEGLGDPSRVLVLAATNLPWLIDEAARRRFVRRQYIPLPEGMTRREQLSKLLERQRHGLSEADLDKLVGLTDGKCPFTSCLHAIGWLTANRFLRLRHHVTRQGRRHGPATGTGRKAA